MDRPVKKTSSAPGAGDRPIDRLAALNHLLKLNNRLMAPFTTHLAKQHRITLNEFRVLMVVGQLGTTASHELAVALGVNTMAISRAVGALDRQGRLEVAIDPASRRRKTLRLTPEGERLYATMMPASRTVATYLFDALGPDELMAFDHFVRVLTERLEAVDERGRTSFLQLTRPEGAEREG